MEKNEKKIFSVRSKSLQARQPNNPTMSLQDIKSLSIQMPSTTKIVVLIKNVVYPVFVGDADSLFMCFNDGDHKVVIGKLGHINVEVNSSGVGKVNAASAVNLTEADETTARSKGFITFADYKKFDPEIEATLCELKHIL